MMYHPTLDKLAELRLTGIRQALMDQAAMADIDELAFEERLGLLLDREATFRAERRLKTRLRTARFRQSATVEDLDYHTPRGLDRTLMNTLIGGDWINKHLNLLITGPTDPVSQCTTSLRDYISRVFWRGSAVTAPRSAAVVGLPFPRASAAITQGAPLQAWCAGITPRWI